MGELASVRKEREHALVSGTIQRFEMELVCGGYISACDAE